MARRKRHYTKKPNFTIGDKVIVEERSFSKIIGKRVYLEAFVPELDIDLRRVWTGGIAKVLTSVTSYEGNQTFEIYYEVNYDPNQNNWVKPPTYVFEEGLHTAYVRKFDANRLRELEESLGK